MDDGADPMVGAKSGGGSRDGLPRDSHPSLPRSFVLAFLAGVGACVLAAGLLPILSLPVFIFIPTDVIDPLTGSVLQSLYEVLVCVAGGFASAFVFAPALSGGRWRLLYLLAASPAPLLWAGAVVRVISDPEHGTVIVMRLACAVGGVILGILAGDRYVRRRKDRVSGEG